MNQVEIHPFFIQNKLIDFCRERGVAMTAYSPLVNGRSGILNDHDLKTIGAKYKKSPAQVGLYDLTKVADWSLVTFLQLIF